MLAASISHNNHITRPPESFCHSAQISLGKHPPLLSIDQYSYTGIQKGSRNIDQLDIVGANAHFSSHTLCHGLSLVSHSLPARYTWGLRET